MVLRRSGQVISSVLLTMILMRGQSSTPKKFDVASIKGYGVQDGNFMIRSQSDGTFRAVGVTLKMLIMFAYSAKAFQVLGLPKWAETDLWEIQAKAGEQSVRADAQARVRALLEERYQLKVHQEHRKMPTYALAVAMRSGPKLAPAIGNEQPGICPCGRSSVTPNRASMAMLADLLSTRLWRVVVDQTGLKAEYAFKLEWVPGLNEYGPEALGLPPATASPTAPDTANQGPTIFTALKEQLGLGLKSQNGQVEVVVIDRVEKPSEN